MKLAEIEFRIHFNQHKLEAYGIRTNVLTAPGMERLKSLAKRAPRNNPPLKPSQGTLIVFPDRVVLELEARDGTIVHADSGHSVVYEYAPGRGVNKRSYDELLVSSIARVLVESIQLYALVNYEAE